MGLDFTKHKDVNLPPVSDEAFWLTMIERLKDAGLTCLTGPQGPVGPAGPRGPEGEPGLIANDKTANIIICYHPGAHKLEQHGAWIDLAVPEDITMKAGEFKIIPFNISMKMPDGYEGYILPRSSAFKKWGILQVNSQGVIEQEYCGNGDIWGMPAYATRDVTIPDGTRIAQFRIQRQQPQLNFIEVDSMPDEDRGGWGSTGEKVDEELLAKQDAMYKYMDMDKVLNG